MEKSAASEVPRVGTIILGLGSNQGDRIRNLERALERLKAHVFVERTSSVYETQPVGVKDQAWFLNLVCVGTTRLKPRALLEFVHEVEKALGRVREGERFGPRTIDIDILAYGDRLIDETDLQVPHPRLAERAFVLQPLVEIAPEWRHPASGKTARELLSTADPDVVRPFADPLTSTGSMPRL